MTDTNAYNYYTYRHQLKFNLKGVINDLPFFDNILRCHEKWELAHTLFLEREFVQAVDTYEQARASGIKVLEAVHLQPILSALANPVVRQYLNDRQTKNTLEALQTFDWLQPLETVGNIRPYEIVIDLVRETTDSPEWIRKVAVPIMAIVHILVPLAKAEALLALGRYDEALTIIDGLFVDSQALLNEVIELPFINLLKANILIQKGDSEYRLWDGHYEQDEDGNETAGALDKATEAYDAALGVLKKFGTYVDEVEQSTISRQEELNQLIGMGDGAQPYIIYNSAVLARRDHLLKTGALKNTKLVNAIKATTQQSKSLQQLGADPCLAGVTFHANRYFGPARPFPLPPITLGERNPRVYELVLMAWSRLQQIANKMNYLGYRYDYVPPWRFSYLLDRARYFTDHTRQLQEKYLNFVSTAEKEDFAEQEAANTLALETQNVAIEQQRVNQATREEEAAIAAVVMAELSKDNAKARVDNYNDFAEDMDKLGKEYLFWATKEGSFRGKELIFRNLATSRALANSAGEVGMLIYLPLVELSIDMGTALEEAIVKQAEALVGMWGSQQELERENLELAVAEAEEAEKVAQAEALVAQAAKEVADLQHTTALMREEFARRAVIFLQNHTTNSELWHRLANQLNRIAQTYLERATELAFLAEQAYEFESGDRLDVIRFDYGLNDTGNYLAGDFLLSDLDTIEHQYITNVTERQQQVRFVVSLARDFPDVLDQLRQYGGALFSVNLRVIEQRFAGLYNCRISSVGIQPLALMDPTRFALQLSHQGSGIIRVHNKPESSDSLRTTDFASWCQDADEQFPIKLQIGQPQTEVFSGMSRQEALAESPNQASQQRAGFGGLAAASTWFIDMSMRENRIDPATLMDVVVTFNLTGYHDDELKEAVLDNLPTTMVQALNLSGQTNFPDAFYKFQQSGEMCWNVTPMVVPTGLQAGRLRNLGIRLIPKVRPSYFGNLIATHQVDLSVDENGVLFINSPIPSLKPELFSINKLQVMFQPKFEEYTENTIKSVAISHLSINWGDSDEFIDHEVGDLARHTYEKPGIYYITMRSIYDRQKMRDFTYKVSVSAEVNLTPPQITYPRFGPVLGKPPEGMAQFELQQLPGKSGDGSWFYTIGDQNGQRPHGIETISLKKGKQYVLGFISMRDLESQLRKHQTDLPELPSNGFDLTIAGMSSSSTQIYDSSEPDSSQPTDIDKLFFSNNEVLSPLQKWDLLLVNQNKLLEQNPFVVSTTNRDKLIVDLSEIRDVVLSLEYEAFTSSN